VFSDFAEDRGCALSQSLTQHTEELEEVPEGWAQVVLGHGSLGVDATYAHTTNDQRTTSSLLSFRKLSPHTAHSQILRDTCSYAAHDTHSRSLTRNHDSFAHNSNTHRGITLDTHAHNRSNTHTKLNHNTQAQKHSTATLRTLNHNTHTHTIVIHIGQLEQRREKLKMLWVLLDSIKGGAFVLLLLYTRVCVHECTRERVCMYMPSVRKFVVVEGKLTTLTVLPPQVWTDCLQCSLRLMADGFDRAGVCVCACMCACACAWLLYSCASV